MALNHTDLRLITLNRYLIIDTAKKCLNIANTVGHTKLPNYHTA